MKENVFQSKVIKYLRENKCLVIKNKADLSTGKGIPDLTVFSGNQDVFMVELKTDTGKLSTQQEEVFNLIMKMNYCDVYILKPSEFDLFKKNIEKRLLTNVEN